MAISLKVLADSRKKLNNFYQKIPINTSWSKLRENKMQLRLPTLLSFNAGYIDTASFLAIHGLFAAHVTGNFVTLGAALVTDNHSGALAKLLALPMFCIAVIASKLIDQLFLSKQKSSYTFLLKSKFILYLLAALISVKYLPFPEEDHWPAFVVGMLLICGMAIQNAMHRLHWVKESPTTVMTGSTTQLMLDVGDLLSKSEKTDKVAIKTRFKKILPVMISFAIGCAIAAIVYHFALMWIFFVPPALMILIYIKKDQYAK